LRLEHPAIESVVLIARGNQTALDHCKAYLEKKLKALVAATPAAQIKVSTVKQMTEAGNCSKTTKTLPIGELIGTKAWDKLFSVDGNYQG
ncbi:hypothetical protein ABTI09_19955, partial [Acinetobacter baumannii]